MIFWKIAIIRQITESGRLEELIGLWRSGFKFTTNDCTPYAEAGEFMMIAMNFELFQTISCDVGAPHAINAYWDSGTGEVLFCDLGFGNWNLRIDELDDRGYALY